jgi:hypothetical protein
LDALRKKRDINGKLPSRLSELIKMIEEDDYKVNDAKYSAKKKCC